MDSIFRNHLKSQTHANNNRKRQYLKKIISKNHDKITMHFYCIICDKEVETDLKKHGGCDRLVQTHIKNNPINSDINKVFYGFVLIHNKKFESYTIEVIFKKELDKNLIPFSKP